MTEKKLKVCLVGSSGGHLTHLYMFMLAKSNFGGRYYNAYQRC